MREDFKNIPYRIQAARSLPGIMAGDFSAQYPNDVIDKYISGHSLFYISTDVDMPPFSAPFIYKFPVNDWALYFFIHYSNVERLAKFLCYIFGN